ncbi:protein ALP1-like [Trichonephila clavipes]|uniref:Protein ALP1-like n=1 Tax=Trichonephila clavipes TaxID=2585209 RepID=A0A8X6SGV8_TRICX|nr:protein ALP1-like [Trichonephila clavipes]
MALDYPQVVLPRNWGGTETNHTVTCLVLKAKDSESYRRFLRMDVSTFEELVALVSPSIEIKNTSMRKAIPAAERIASTLRYLTTGSEIQVPESGNEWKMVAEEFWAKWNFPLCLGAMDGKHIRIKPPSHSGATYRNYKGLINIVLLALVDANLKFLYVDAGTNG